MDRDGAFVVYVSVCGSREIGVCLCVCSNCVRIYSEISVTIAKTLAGYFPNVRAAP